MTRYHIAKTVLVLLGFWLGSIGAALPVHAKDVVDPSLLKAKSWRFVGPYRGGRVTTVAGVVGQPQVYYMGAAGGGVWKTTNAGVSWKNISDKDFGVGTIGAIAVAPSDPNVIYVGTGEAPIRGVTTSHGDGMYRSTDAGKTWTHIGLKQSGQISRVRVHPTNPDIAWVAVQGQIWGENTERGIFKTTDGGATWRHVLAISGETGAGELAIDPSNPRILYAAMWQNGRTPWYVKSGGTEGGIFKSTDGGETWAKLKGGLPTTIGKVGVDVVASQPSRVYAVVEAEEGKGGLYRSDNYGESWRLVSEDRLIHSRPWYYNRVTADPLDPETVYVMNVTYMKSTDGGETFEIVRTLPHGDHHDLWVNPLDSKNLINANDGGATISFDGGQSWSRVDNQPTAQFYRVTTDNMTPYRIYGGQQDNTTVAILSKTYGAGVSDKDFFAVGGGESAHIAFDENNPRFVYATTINSTLTEFDTVTKRRRPIKPYPEYVFGRQAKNIFYRTNWNAPVAANPHDPSIIYYGTEKLLKTDDRGVTWTEISPDLTRNEKDRQGINGGPITNESVGAEYYNTVFYIKPSPHEKGTIWVGSDDGLVHVTRDEGGSWDNVTPRGAVEGQINAIDVSPHDAGTAYVALAAFKLNDFRPYIYKTTNYGKRWKRIDKGLPEDTFVRVVREDPVRKGLLYAGTEAGMFVSFDDGDNWQSLRRNLPPVPITDLKIRQGDLVAATQGRGFWVLDDLELLRQVVGDEHEAGLHVFTPSDTQLVRRGGWAQVITSPNPPSGVPIIYALKEDQSEPLKIDIMNASGTIVRSYSSEESERDTCIVANTPPRAARKPRYPSKTAGTHVWYWNMRRAGHICVDKVSIFAGYAGPNAEPGAYSARVTVGERSETVSFNLLPDPRIEAVADDYTYLSARIDEATLIMNDLLGSIDSLRTARDQIKDLVKAYDDPELSAMADSVYAKIEAWESEVTQVKFRIIEDEDSWPSKLDFQVRHLIDALDNAGPPVSAGALKRYEDLAAEWQGHKATYTAIISGEIKAINDWAAAKAVPLVRP